MPTWSSWWLNFFLIMLYWASLSNCIWVSRCKLDLFTYSWSQNDWVGDFRLWTICYSSLISLDSTIVLLWQSTRLGWRWLVAWALAFWTTYSLLNFRRIIWILWFFCNIKHLSYLDSWSVFRAWWRWNWNVFLINEFRRQFWTKI